MSESERQRDDTRDPTISSFGLSDVVPEGEAGVAARTAERIDTFRGGIERSVEEGGAGFTEDERKNLSDALDLAIRVHGDQTRKPEGPYINHVVSVSDRMLSEYGVKDAELITAGLLHDTVEDQSEKLAEMYEGSGRGLSLREKALEVIGEQFSERVMNLVAALSNPELPSGLDAIAKNEAYVEHVKAATQDSDVAVIKLADFSDNALRLENLLDVSRRLKLSKKYIPVMEMFIERIQEDDLPIEGGKKEEIIASIKEALDGAKLFIEENEVS